jgi:hypothetical protein
MEAKHSLTTSTSTPTDKEALTMLRNSTIAVTVALAAITAASAHNYDRDALCALTDNMGNKLVYRFALGPTDNIVYETGFLKNATAIVSQEGSWPTWGLVDNGSQTASFTSNGYSITMSSGSTQNGYLVTTAALAHGNKVIGNGTCTVPVGPTTTAAVSAPPSGAPTVPTTVTANLPSPGALSAALGQ